MPDDDKISVRIILVESCMRCPYCMIKLNLRGCAHREIKNRWNMYPIEEIDDILEGCPLEIIEATTYKNEREKIASEISDLIYVDWDLSDVDDITERIMMILYPEGG